MKPIKKISGIFLFSVFACSAHASDDVVDTRIAYEQDAKNNPFLLMPYEPNYVLPAYYTQKPDYGVYANNTPGNEKVNKVDVKFQFSFKAPLAYHLFSPNNTFYFAYTQLSYWQAYNTSAFFRETDYEPSFFMTHFWDKNLGHDWRWKFINGGVVHQSNGRGGDNERGWNRAYAEAVFAHQNWMVDIKPWYIFKQGVVEAHNPDIAHYLGHGSELVSYKYGEQVFSVTLENEAESRFRRGAETLAWSFPMGKHVKGYVQAFSGYGQSLIEYNHFTNSMGVGIALNDWI